MKMNLHPLQLFAGWYAEERQRSTDLNASACCLSTIGLDGFPNARFVSLKEVKENTFIITGSLETRKGKEIANCSKIALTFWWTNTLRQVRIQGEATLLPAWAADSYFKDRSMDAQIVSVISKPGQILDNKDALYQKFSSFEKPAREKMIERPEDWGGYSINPVRIEFMEFRQNRLHERVLYQDKNGEWIANFIQP